MKKNICLVAGIAGILLASAPTGAHAEGRLRYHGWGGGPHWGLEVRILGGPDHIGDGAFPIGVGMEGIWLLIHAQVSSFYRVTVFPFPLELLLT